MSRRAWPLRAVLLVAPLVACGGEEIMQSPNKGRESAPAAAASGAAAAATETKVVTEYSEADFVENDKNRDPFRTFASLFVESATKKAFAVQRTVILSQYAIEDMKLVAIVTGGDYPRAMVLDPAGKGWVLKKGDFLGRPDTVHTGGTNGTDYQLNWRVDRVRDGDLVLIREDPAQPNIAPVSRVISLHPEGDKSQGAL